MLKQVTIVFLCVLTLPVLAQRSIYKGDFEWQGEFKGTAEYEFVKDKSGKEIADGKFHFSLVERDSVNQALLMKKEINGQYKDGIKEGRWTYLSANHIVIVKDVEEFNVITDLASDMIRIRAEYKNDLPHGKWLYSEDTYQNEIVKQLTFSEPLQMKEGFLTGKIHIINKNLEKEQYVTGFLNEKGLMDSLWVMVYQSNDQFIREERLYDEGFLLKLSKKDAVSGKEISNVTYTRNIERLASLKANEKVDFRISSEYFGPLFNNGYSRNESRYKSQLEGNNFLEEQIRPLFNYDKRIYFKNGGWLKFPIRTKRFEYPIDPLKAKDAEEISKIYKDLIAKVKKNKESNALSINKNRTDSLAFAYAFFQSMDSKVKDLEEIVALYESGEIKYVDEESFFEQGLGYLASYDTIQYVFDDKERVKVINNRKVIETKEQLSRLLLRYLENEYHLVDKFAEYVKSVLEKLEIDSSISDLDEKIVTLKDIVVDLYAGTNYFSDKHEKLIKRIEKVFLQDLYEKKQNEYAKTDTYGKKVEKADEVIDLLNELDKRHEEFYKIFEKRDEIDELYYENYFNAFTFSSYDQRAKERLYKLGNEKLFNYLVDALMEENDYNNLSEHLSRIHNLQKRMVQLREEDTRKIERKLRRTTKPSQIATVLEVEL
jgi:hypothetical protein